MSSFTGPLHSPETVASYRDTLKLLLQFIQTQQGREPATLCVTDLEVTVILSFLDYLEAQRHNSARSRNARLAAIRTFFRWVALRDPQQVNLATRVLAIPQKRTDKKLVQALTRAEMEALLAAPDLAQTWGRRDHALLLTLYNSGARVSEIIALQRGQVQFGATTFLQLQGKGRKQRTVPLWTKTSRALQIWFQELAGASHQLAFPSARGKPLSRDGVDYLLQQAVRGAAVGCASLRGRKISPHTLRHTTAMHLLQAGVDITVIRVMVRLRKPGNHAHLFGSRFTNQGKSTEQVGTSGRGSPAL